MHKLHSFEAKYDMLELVILLSLENLEVATTKINNNRSTVADGMNNVNLPRNAMQCNAMHVHCAV